MTDTLTAQLRKTMVTDRAKWWLNLAFVIWGFASIIALVGAVLVGLPRGSKIALIAACMSWYAVHRYLEWKHKP